MSMRDKCEKCGRPADNHVRAKNQWLCLECALGLRKGTIAEFRALEPDYPTAKEYRALEAAFRAERKARERAEEALRIAMDSREL